MIKLASNSCFEYNNAGVIVNFSKKHDKSVNSTSCQLNDLKPI